MGVLESSQCNWNVCKYESYCLRTGGLLHIRIAYNFTPVDRARVSHGKFTSWLAEILAVSGEISVKRDHPLHM